MDLIFAGCGFYLLVKSSQIQFSQFCKNRSPCENFRLCGIQFSYISFLLKGEAKAVLHVNPPKSKETNLQLAIYCLSQSATIDPILCMWPLHAISNQPSPASVTKECAIVMINTAIATGCREEIVRIRDCKLLTSNGRQIKALGQLIPSQVVSWMWGKQHSSQHAWDYAITQMSELAIVHY